VIQQLKEILDDYEKFFAHGRGILHSKKLDPETGQHVRILKPVHIKPNPQAKYQSGINR
jgi:hypothetical protein